MNGNLFILHSDNPAPLKTHVVFPCREHTQTGGMVASWRGEQMSLHDMRGENRRDVVWCWNGAGAQVCVVKDDD